MSIRNIQIVLVVNVVGSVDIRQLIRHSENKNVI